MSSYGPSDEDMVNPIKAGGVDTDKMAGILVIGAMVGLILIHRGFRGVSISGVTGGIVRG